MRILCLDIGSKRIGMAASDPLGFTAQPLKVLLRRGGEFDLSEIAALCEELEVDRIIVGIPLNEGGGIGPQAEKVNLFVKRMEEYLRKNKIDAPIEMWDERYSTATAEARLIEADVSRKKRKRVIDKMAAAAILEDYLEAHEAQTGEGAEG